MMSDNVRQQLLTVLYNEKIAPEIYRMRLSDAVTDGIIPGQFIDIRLEGFFLRRPISVYDFGQAYIDIIYKAVGKGTEALSLLQGGAALDTLTGLGNGYDISCSGSSPLLIGGGVGIPPLYCLAKKLIAEGKKVTVAAGFNSKSEIICTNELEKLGASVFISTVDGSFGVKGFVTDIIREKALKYSYFYACGPEPMLKAVCKASETSGELSFEERMGCGFGACMGCSCKTLTGYKRICKDGPVMKKEELLWT